MEQTAPKINQISGTERLLMGPGPSNAPASVLEIMARPLVGHMDPQFNEIMDQIQEMLRYAFQTENQLTYPVSATGSAGMETVLVNLVEPGDEMLIGINGVFGGRMADMAGRAGANVSTISTDWGSVFSFDELKAAVEKHKPKMVGLVHAETSTGAAQPLSEIGPWLRERGILLLVDCVTSLTGSELLIDDWCVDAAYSGTQKCLSCPPGLSPVTFSEHAEQKMNVRSGTNQSWYFDLSMVRQYWGEERTYHHTAPVTMAYALHEGLRLVCDEGLEQRWQRHKDVSAQLRQAIEAMGFSYLVKEENRLPQLNSVFFPEGVDEAAVRKKLLDDYSIEVGSGLGSLKGKIWRIGIMGETCSRYSVNRLVSALEEVL